MAKKKKPLPHGERIQDQPRPPVKKPSQDGEFGGLNLPYGPYKKKPARIADKPRKPIKKKRR